MKTSPTLHPITTMITTTMRIKTERKKTMLTKNRNLIVGSEKLFISNTLLTELALDHDILGFLYDPRKSIIEQVNEIYKNIKGLNISSYSRIVFIGYKKDCELMYHLSGLKNLPFDCAVFVNPEISNPNVSPPSLTKLYCVGNRSNHTPLKGELLYQKVNTPFPTRSPRLAKEIAAILTYHGYSQLFLAGEPSRIL